MKYYIFAFFLFFIIKLSAQEQDTINADSLDDNTIVKAKKNDYLPLTKSPSGAVFRSLTFPGWGQIYVNNYCKAPVFIGLAGFLWYRIITNHFDYKDYKKQLDIIENQSSFEYRIVEGKMVTAIDNRDLSGLYLLGVYILSMVDAYSGAHLFDFNISSDLSYSIKLDTDFTGKPYIKVGFFYTLK